MRRTPKIPDQALAKIPGKALYRMATAGAEIEIGGDHPSLVLPEMRSKKWGGECWLNVRHKDADSLDKKDRAKNFKRKGKPAVEVPVSKRKRRHQFIEGSVEWDIVYDDRAALPADGIERFQLDSPAGLTWHYQPPLTQEEIDSGCERPENVIGSYAGYFNKSGKYVDKSGSEIADYETGKFCHIYRPEMIASDGARIWLEQAIVDDELRVTLPDSSWFDIHPGPWTLDPIIGYDSVGASEKKVSYSYIEVYALGEAPEACIIHSASFRVRVPYVDGDMLAFLFKGESFSDTTIDFLESDQVSVLMDFDDWLTHSFETAPAVNTGEGIFVSCHLMVDTSYRLKYDNAPGCIIYSVPTNSGGFNGENDPDPSVDLTAALTTIETMRVSTYVTYEVAGGGGISLAPNSLNQLNSISAPALVQSHILNGDALNQGNALSGLELTIAQELAIANLISSNSLSSVGLAQRSNLSVDSLVNAQSINGVDLVQFHLLGVDGLLNSQTLEGIDLKQANILGVDDLTISANLESLVLAQKNLLTLDSLVCANSLGSLELNLGILLNLEGLTQGNNLGALDLKQKNLLALESLNQLNSIETSELVQKALLGIESLVQTSILEGLTLSSAILLAVESLQNAATLQGVELLSGVLLSVNSLTQQSSIEEITLTQKNILEVASMLESNQIQEVSIYIPVEGNLITISAKSSGFGFLTKTNRFGFSTKTNSFGFIGKGDN